jgi:cation-transporting ATPase 13A3/4/5
MLTQYTQKSYRVLSVAYRLLPNMTYAKVQRAQREDLEKDLTFLGFIVMRNMLKAGTTETITSLHRANIRTLMATGDNIMTALSVAQECHMIDEKDKIIIIEIDEKVEGLPKLVWKYTSTHQNETNNKINSKEIISQSVNVSFEQKTHIAINGQTFKAIKEHYPNLLPKLAVHGTVFARMSPEQKQLLIENLQEVGYYVGMCGDGANDCGALKAGLVLINIFT